MRAIYHCFWVDAPVPVVYRAITERDGLAGWWTRDLAVSGEVGEAWIGTRVLFEMRPSGGRTKVCFSHVGWREQTEYVGECSFHWAKHFISLQDYGTHGAGSPDKGRGDVG